MRDSLSAGTSQGSEQLPNGATPAQPCLSGLPTESDLPTNLGIRVTRRRGNAGEATVTKVVPLSLRLCQISVDLGLSVELELQAVSCALCIWQMSPFCIRTWSR